MITEKVLLKGPETEKGLGWDWKIIMLLCHGIALWIVAS